MFIKFNLIIFIVVAILDVVKKEMYTKFKGSLSFETALIFNLFTVISYTVSLEGYLHQVL